MMLWEPRRPLLTAASIVAVWVLPLLALAAVAPVALLAISAASAGVALSMFDSIWETVKQTHTPPHLRARLGSFDQLGSLGLVPFGYLLGAAILATVGATTGLIGGALILIAATFSIIADPCIRDLMSQEKSKQASFESRPAASEAALATIESR